MTRISLVPSQLGLHLDRTHESFVDAVHSLPSHFLLQVQCVYLLLRFAHVYEWVEQFLLDETHVDDHVGFVLGVEMSGLGLEIQFG